MMFCCGDTTQITTDQWRMIELRSEQTAEEILKRLLGGMENAFKPDPAEIFIPEQRSRECSFSLMTGNYVFVRADDPAKIAKLRRITGVQGIVTKDDSTRINSFISVDNDYVQSLQNQVMDAYYKRGAAIKVDGWVKILDGHDRDLYGHVESVGNGRACVRVELKTKLWFVDTSVFNLLDCSDIDPCYRVYYYSPTVEQMIQEDPLLAAKLLKPDLFYDEAANRKWLYGEDDPGILSTEPSIRTSRERTPTRFVRSLVQTGERNVRKLLVAVVEAIRRGQLRRPRTTTVIWHIIRAEMLMNAFPADPKLTTYTDFIKRYGEAYNLTPNDVDLAFPELSDKIVPKTQVPPAPKPVASPVPTPLPAASKVTTTTTAMVRDYLCHGGRDLRRVLTRVQAEMEAGRVRAPKHMDSMIQAVHRQVLAYFRRTKHYATFAEVLEKEGSGLAISRARVAETFPSLEGIILSARDVQIRQRVVTHHRSVPLDPGFTTVPPRKALTTKRQSLTIPA